MKDKATWSEVIVKWLLVASSAVFFFTCGFGSFCTLTQRALHWLFMATAAYLLLPTKAVLGRIIKFVLAAAAMATSVYVIVTWPQRIFGVGEVSGLDMAMGIAALVVLLIAIKLTSVGD